MERRRPIDTGVRAGDVDDEEHASGSAGRRAKWRIPGGVRAVLIHEDDTPSCHKLDLGEGQGGAQKTDSTHPRRGHELDLGEGQGGTKKTDFTHPHRGPATNWTSEKVRGVPKRPISPIPTGR